MTVGELMAMLELLPKDTKVLRATTYGFDDVLFVDVETNIVSADDLENTITAVVLS